MLLGRLFSYPDTHRSRIGPNYLQLPINRPRVAVNSYNKDGAMRYENPGDPVHAPNSVGGPAADQARFGEQDTSWDVGELQRSAYVPHAEDDDVVQPRALVETILTDAERTALAATSSAAVEKGLSNGSKPGHEPV